MKSKKEQSPAEEKQTAKDIGAPMALNTLPNEILIEIFMNIPVVQLRNPWDKKSYVVLRGTPKLWAKRVLDAPINEVRFLFLSNFVNETMLIYQLQI